MNNEINEINKKEVCFAVLASQAIVTGVNSKGVEVQTFETPRKLLLDQMYNALIAAGVDKHDIKPNLIPSYYQMGRMEFISGKGAYAHHKVAKKEKAEKSTGPQIPEDAQWQLQMDDAVEYFRTRQIGHEFAVANGFMKSQVQKIAV